MKKMIVIALALASFSALQAEDMNAMDLCETTLMECNNKCDSGDSTETCYQTCQENYEACLNEADNMSEESSGEESEELKEE